MMKKIQRTQEICPIKGIIKIQKIILMPMKDTIDIEKTKENSSILQNMKKEDIIDQINTKMDHNLHLHLINIKVIKIEINLMKSKNTEIGTISKIQVEINHINILTRIKNVLLMEITKGIMVILTKIINMPIFKAMMIEILNQILPMEILTTMVIEIPNITINMEILSKTT